jgi:excinuclease UvrABC nuclease subunit
MRFEEAQKIKEKIEILENYQSRSTIINPKITNIDVFSIVSDESAAYVNFLQISHGSIIRSHTMEIKKKLEETDEELLELAIIELRERFKLLSKEIIVPFEIDLGENIKITVPQLGDKKQKQTKSKEEQSFDRVFEKLKKRRIETTSLFSYLTFLVPKKDQTNETYAFSEHFFDAYDNNCPQHEGFAGFQSLDWSKTILFSIPI